MAEAAFSNYNSILVGDLAAGLSGAGSAVVGDVSSASFYNPALLSPLEGSSFSAAVGIYKKYDTVYDKTEDFLAAPLRVNKGYFRSLPAATGNVVQWNDLKLGLSIVAPDFDQFSGDVFSQASKFKNLNMTDESIWVGGSLARAISSMDHVGLTLYYTARNFSSQLDERSQTSPTDISFQTIEKKIKENSIVGILGYFRQIDEKWSLGSSLRLNLIKVSGKGSLDDNSIVVSGGAILTGANQYDSLKSECFIPARFNLGVSYRPNSTYLWAAEVNLHEGYSYNDLRQPQYAMRIRRKAVWNFSSGGEMAIRSWLKFRGGIFTNFSAHPNPDPGLGFDQADRVDMLGFSANVVFISEKRIAYTFGGYYSGGWGRSVQASFGQFETISKRQNIFTMLVGTNFLF
jgi:hypothetical protein